jgi:hypothetical protein
MIPINLVSRSVHQPVFHIIYYRLGQQRLENAILIQHPPDQLEMNRHILSPLFLCFHLVQALSRCVFFRFYVLPSEWLSLFVTVLYVQPSDQTFVILQPRIVMKLGAVHQIMAPNVTRKTVMICPVPLKNLVY